MADASGARRVVVVGAGIGGLVAAVLLAARGVEVTLVERASEPGGKIRRQWVDGAPIDAGPTVFTLRWILDQILAAAGTTLDRELTLQPLDVLARHAWRAGGRLDLFTDAERSADAIGTFAGAAERRRFVAFCDEARRLYARLEGPYIRSERPTLTRMATDLGLHGVSQLAALGPFATLWRALSRRFSDPRLRQLFGRYATYCGSSPWAAPATLMLVAHVELAGVWSVAGGMHAIPRMLADVARRRGAVLRFGTPCDEIIVRGGRACGVRLVGGERLEAEAVVFNGDASALARGFLGETAIPATVAVAPRDRSLSAVTWAIRARTSGFPLLRHNVFFDDDYRSEFDDVFRHGRLPHRGTVYVCAQDRADAAVDVGPERLLCLVNAPALADTRPLTSDEIDACEQNHFRLMRDCGLEIERSPSNTVRTTPADFHRLFPATGGALYGPATHGWMALFRRPSAESRLPGLFLTGGSVHPGPGVPMAAMSGQLAVETLMAHLDSTRRSRRVVISGGTSTRSPMTAGTASP